MKPVLLARSVGAALVIAICPNLDAQAADDVANDAADNYAVLKRAMDKIVPKLVAPA